MLRLKNLTIQVKAVIFGLKCGFILCGGWYISHIVVIHHKHVENKHRKTQYN